VPLAPQATLVALLALLTLTLLLRSALRLPFTVRIYLPYLWSLALAFTLTALLSVNVGLWVLAALCFTTLREYFTLADLRIQDRWGMLVAYVTIPFMMYYISIDWYGMFIISVPVWAFLVVPFAITLGSRDPQGSVLSIGAIDLGLFLLVYCVGHIGYLMYYSVWMAVSVVAAVAVCDLFAYTLNSRDRPARIGLPLQLVAPVPFTFLFAWILSPWSNVPPVHCAVLACLIPFLVAIGAHTVTYLESDLGIDRSIIPEGGGRGINSIKSFLYAAPVAFHYLRYFLDDF
jgi:phosphatidate cytidylyltransferase